jgi:sensor histidine kinase regulating citrate/malate metabolism
LCIVLGNLLDNAACALEQRAENEREFELLLIERKKVLKLIVKNTYGNQVVKTANGFVSTKRNDGRIGQGLRNVNNIIEKYNGEIEYENDDKWFVVNAMLFVPSN